TNNNPTANMEFIYTSPFSSTIIDSYLYKLVVST
ncbi:unnamed protein product, partial [marine sediment metagenome]